MMTANWQRADGFVRGNLICHYLIMLDTNNHNMAITRLMGAKGGVAIAVGRPFGRAMIMTMRRTMRAGQQGGGGGDLTRQFIHLSSELQLSPACTHRAGLIWARSKWRRPNEAAWPGELFVARQQPSDKFDSRYEGRSQVERVIKLQSSCLADDIDEPPN